MGGRWLAYNESREAARRRSKQGEARCEKGQNGLGKSDANQEVATNWRRSECAPARRRAEKD